MSLKSDFAAGPRAARLSGPVSRGVDYILARSLAGEPLTVEELARHCHSSAACYSRRFKAETGQSPYAFARRVRLEEGAFRLKVEPGRSITEIGCDCGYSPSNFSWAFRQQLGQSPARFRREAGASAVRHPFCHLPKAGLACALPSVDWQLPRAGGRLGRFYAGLPTLAAARFAVFGALV